MNQHIYLTRYFQNVNRVVSTHLILFLKQVVLLFQLLTQNDFNKFRVGYLNMQHYDHIFLSTNKSLDNEIHQAKQKKSLNNFISIACSSTIVSDYFEEKKGRLS
jgi:hypothetical protein